VRLVPFGQTFRRPWTDGRYHTGVALEGVPGEG
jgi:hypothetical protein